MASRAVLQWTRSVGVVSLLPVSILHEERHLYSFLFLGGRGWDQLGYCLGVQPLNNEGRLLLGWVHKARCLVTLPSVLGFLHYLNGILFDKHVIRAESPSLSSLETCMLRHSTLPPIKLSEHLKFDLRSSCLSGSQVRHIPCKSF